jgi:peroxiredoxin
MMLQAGDPIPDAQVWLAPRESLRLHELVEEGPILVLFYLFDWSGT